jgi:RimJ/RimL family protein N-acetyltransferase
VAELAFPDPPLSDGVVRLRPVNAGDVAFVVAACQDPEVSRYSPMIPFPYTEADAREWLDGIEPMRRAGSGLDLLIADAPTGHPLGVIGIGGLDRRLRSATTIGYWLAREARGRGAMTRAVRLLARWAFDELGVARLALTTDPDNVASQRVAERCGFVREGRLRSHIRIRHSGRRRDSLVYGLLPGELAETPGA